MVTPPLTLLSLVLPPQTHTHKTTHHMFQIFLCEQEHNAKANLLGGAQKWAKNFLATGVKGFQPYNAALSGETGGSAMFGTYRHVKSSM